MAHDLFQNKMAFVGEVPWHGLGTPVPPSVSAAKMIASANLAWEVKKVPAPGAVRVDHPESYDRYLLMREAVGNEREDVALGMVGHGYTLLQNTSAFEFFEPLVSSGWAKFHTAGALGNGERVWVLVKLDESIRVAPGDVVDRYLLLSNNHDGRGAVSVRFTPIRVVCQNTLSYAKQRSSGIVSVRHSANVKANLLKAQAEKLRQVVDRTFADAADLFGQMALRRLSSVETDEFLRKLFPPTEKQQRDRREPERWLRIRHILEDARVTPAETRGTLWALYNAVTRDEDYRTTREQRPENRLDRIWFGAGENLKKTALQLSRRFLAAA